MPAPIIEKASAAPVSLLVAVVAAVVALSENDTTTAGTVGTTRPRAGERAVAVATTTCSATGKEGAATVTLTGTGRAGTVTTIATLKAGISLTGAVAIAIMVRAGISARVGTTRTGMVRTGRMPTAGTTRQMVLLSQSPQNVRRVDGTVKGWCFRSLVESVQVVLSFSRGFLGFFGNWLLSSWGRRRKL